MLLINRNTEYKRTPIKIIVSIFLLLGVVLSDAILITISSTLNYGLINTVRILDIFIVGISVITLLISENRERGKDRC